MIKSDHGSSEIQGTLSEILADYIVLTRTLLNSKAFDISDIMYCINIAVKPEEEIANEATNLRKETKETIEKMKETLADLRRIFEE